MSNKINKKQKLAEILYNLPSESISTDLIRWVMSYLPDDVAERGTEKEHPGGQVDFNLKADTNQPYLVVGMKDTEAAAMLTKLRSCFPQEAIDRGVVTATADKATVMSKFFPLLDEREKALLAMYGVPSFQEHIMHIALKTGNEAFLQALVGEPGDGMTVNQRKELLEKVQLLVKLSKLGGKHGLNLEDLFGK